MQIHGLSVRLLSYRINKGHVVEIELASVTIARAIADTPEDAEHIAIKTARQRLRATGIDPNLTVGG